jgi:hypothetical protein
MRDHVLGAAWSVSGQFHALPCNGSDPFTAVFAADFFTAVFLAGAAFFAAFAGAFFTAVFLVAVFLVAARSAFAASARFAALAARAFARFATKAAFRALLSFRFGFDRDGAGSVALLAAAHLFRCASAIAFRPAALIFRRLCLPVGTSDVAAGSAGLPDNMARSSAT